MVWQETEHSAMVVMLTKSFEIEMAKSLQYFPFHLDSSPAKYTDTDSKDDFTAVLALKYINSNIIRSLTVRGMEMGVSFESQNRLKAKETHIDQESTAPVSRIVYHCQFEGWSDFSVPERDDRKALMDLCRATRRNELETNGSPRFVHCDAGSGRTGTFIALDFLLGELDKGAMEDCEAVTDMIFDTVDSLRKQRMLMVHTPELYRFLYETLKEELTQKLVLDAKSDITTWVRSMAPLAVAEY